MPSRPDSADYRQLLISDAPLLDTRAPQEFARGAFPTAVNLPLITDAERHQVGIRYQQAGQQSALELGHSLVAGERKQQRLSAWMEFAGKNPGGYLYCFRGGLRSQIVQAWLREAGVDYPRVLGGYKAMRRFLLEELPQSLAGCRLILISGKAGAGKTRVISALEAAVDLEGQARHRGSAFGGLLQDQPSQIDFENALGIALLKKSAAGRQTLFVEDEGRLIGRLSLPEELRQCMHNAPMLVIEEELRERVEVVIEDYVIDLGRRFAKAFPGDGPAQHENKLRLGLFKLRKRLGGLLYQQLEAKLAGAFQQQRGSGDLSGHRQWIEPLLLQYYDPMYEYQIRRRTGSVLARGKRAAIIEQARTLAGSRE